MWLCFRHVLFAVGLAYVRMGRSFDEDLIGGAVGGLLSCVLLQPFDVIKTVRAMSLYKRLQQPNTSLKGTLRSITVAELWRGSVPTVLRTVPGSALYFYALNRIRLTSNENMSNLLSGAIARTVVGFVMMPFTVLKVRFESSDYKYSTLWNASKHIYSSNGIRGFFRAFPATAIRDAPVSLLCLL
jgi:solute carrier family 25 protein 38